MIDIKTMCAQRLQELSKNITLEDREDAQKKMPISRPTLDRYLKGEVIKIGTATRLIKFFDKRTIARIKDLEQSNVA